MPPPSPVHTVFSIGNNAYQRWQAHLLAYSHARARQPGPLTCLVSGTSDRTPVLDGEGRTYFTGAWSPHPLTGDDYAPYNKPSALKAWLRHAPPAEETILLLDPDCIFLAPLEGPLPARGRPVAQHVRYLDIRRINSEPIVRRLCRRPEAVQEVGIPTLIHRDDLAALAPRWLAKTEEIRRDPMLREQIGWVSEMWAYSIAAAELGLEHRVEELATFNTDDRADLPIVHYCYDTKDPGGRWFWSKRSYQPWSYVPDPPKAVPRGAKAVVEIVNEYAARETCGTWPGKPFTVER